ncbi:TPA: LysR family transcriptional regulator [Photobacterium damselae]
MKNTDLNLVPIFVAIYEEQNLSKAATRLDISQPAVSKGLARLRDLYDEPLFHRNTSGVEPTTFAIDIYPAMVTALKNFTSTLSSVREFDPKTSHRIFSLACMSVASYELMPHAMKLIHQQAPNIALEIHPLFTEDYETDLRLQRYDLIIDMAPKGRTVLKFESIYTEKLNVVCSENHPRIGEQITLDEFLSEEHVVVSRWHSRRSLLSENDIPELEQRKIIYRASGALEMLPVINGSEFIGMLPKSTINAFAANYQVKGLPLPFPDSEHHLCAIWHPSRTSESAHKWLRKMIKQAGKDIRYEQ